jgi:hypothetical protein
MTRQSQEDLDTYVPIGVTAFRENISALLRITVETLPLRLHTSYRFMIQSMWSLNVSLIRNVALHRALEFTITPAVHAMLQWFHQASIKSGTAGPTPLNNTTVFPLTNTVPTFSLNSNSLPPSTWNTLNLSFSSIP